ncbi:MAG TPA: F0F1 ATP synthase subunit delta [Mycobacteriales bacterium]|nr:F0F1 ATP synthase subunit delta [Mycobacteriales bacterium]
MQGASRASLAVGRRRLDALGTELAEDALMGLADDLFAAVRLLDGEHGLRRTLSDPGLPGEAKQNVIAQLLGSQMSPAAVGVVQALAAGRWSRSVDLVDSIERLAVEALFARAERAGSLDEVEDQLFRFGRIVDREPALWAALADPTLPTENKLELVHALLAGKVTPVSLRLIDSVVRQPRGRAVDEAVAELARLAAERQSRYIADVHATVELTEAERARLTDRLGAMFDHDVRLQVSIDPALVGGIVIRVGDEVIDGSVATRLSQALRGLT